MPSDMSIDNNGQIYWKSKHGVMRTAAKIDLTQTAKHTPTHIDFKYPSTEGVPLYYLLDGLHTGLLIHESWPWINDLFALCAIILIITGLKRWWRNKWL